MAEHYHPSADHVAFANSVGKSLMAILPLSRLHEAREESAQTWSALNELGIFDISIPEADGGSGLGAIEETLITLELGRRVVAPSVLASLGAAHLRKADGSLAVQAGQRVAAAYSTDYPAAEPLSSGDRATASLGKSPRVVCVEDSQATLLLVRTATGAVLFERPQTPTNVLDSGLWASQLSEYRELASPRAQVSDSQMLRLRLLDAAALAGIARAALDMAVEYAGLREQFGRPIGSFQAVKHHCANMALAARCAADQLSFAAVAVDSKRTDAALQVECAFHVAAQAAVDNSGKNIQVHGGIGFSDEADPHLLLKRTRVLIDVAGGLDAATQRIAAIPAQVA